MEAIDLQSNITSTNCLVYLVTKVALPVEVVSSNFNAIGSKILSYTPAKNTTLSQFWNWGRWDNVKIEENNKKFIWDGIEVLVKLLNRNAILKNLVLTGKTVEGAVNANELEETKAKLIKFENLTQAEKIEIENRMEIWLHQRKFLSVGKVGAKVTTILDKFDQETLQDLSALVLFNMRFSELSEFITEETIPVIALHLSYIGKSFTSVVSSVLTIAKSMSEFEEFKIFAREIHASLINFKCINEDIISKIDLVLAGDNAKTQEIISDMKSLLAAVKELTDKKIPFIEAKVLNFIELNKGVQLAVRNSAINNLWVGAEKVAGIPKLKDLLLGSVELVDLNLTEKVQLFIAGAAAFANGIAALSDLACYFVIEKNIQRATVNLMAYDDISRTLERYSHIVERQRQYINDGLLSQSIKVEMIEAGKLLNACLEIIDGTQKKRCKFNNQNYNQLKN